MVSVSHITTKAVQRRPFLEEAISKGIINYVALAEELRPEIEKELEEKVKTSAIMMALRRIAETLQASKEGKTKFFGAKAKQGFKDSDMFIKSGLFEATVKNLPSNANKISRIHEFIDVSEGDFLAINYGVHEITVISNNKHRQRILKLLDSESPKSIPGLAAVTVKISASAVDTVGMFYIVTKALNWENINIVEIVSTLTEMTFIVREEDVPKAFSVLKAL